MRLRFSFANLFCKRTIEFYPIPMFLFARIIERNGEKAYHFVIFFIFYCFVMRIYK